jgi:hypothetical protein
MPANQPAAADGAAAAAAADTAAAPWRSPVGCTPPSAAAVDAAFRAWCDAEGVLWPKCGIGHSEATGRCVVAREDIDEGEVVVEVRVGVWGCGWGCGFGGEVRGAVVLSISQQPAAAAAGRQRETVS